MRSSWHTGYQEDAAIPQAVIALGKGPQLQVIAEGAETQVQADFPAREDSFVVQSFLYATPMLSEEFERYLNNH